MVGPEVFFTQAALIFMSVLCVFVVGSLTTYVRRHVSLRHFANLDNFVEK